MATTEVRQFGYGDLLVVYTDHEPTRQQIKQLKAFTQENGYYDAHNRLLAVDLYIDETRLNPDQRKRFRQQINAQEIITA